MVQNEWEQEMMVTTMGVMLDNLDLSFEDGQKYITTCNIYYGSNGTEDRSLIKETGVWIQNKKNKTQSKPSLSEGFFMLKFHVLL